MNVYDTIGLNSNFTLNKQHQNRVITTSVIIINYHTAHLTEQAVNSVWSHANPATTEVIVVDNGSSEEDFHRLHLALHEKPNTFLLRSRINLGFGGGNMYGVQKARGVYYAFLNSDAMLVEDSFKVMTSFLEQHPEVSIVGATAVDEQNQAYKGFDYSLSLRSELLGNGFLQLLNSRKFPSRWTRFQRPTKVGSVPGSFLFCRAKDFNQVGGFDTNLFLYYEEKDLSYRIMNELGKASYLLPQTSYIHLKGKSTPPSYPFKKELRISQFYTIRKNLGTFKYLIFYCFCFFKYLLKAPFSSKNRKYLGLVFRGASLAESLKHKQSIQPETK